MRTLTKLTLAIALVLVGYAGVLGYVALETERDVQFWPPRIGPAPISTTVIDMSGMESDLAEIKDILNNELVVLNARLAEARENMTKEGSVGGLSNYEWRQNVRNYDKDIQEVQGELISRINKVQYALESVERSCTDPRLSTE